MCVCAWKGSDQPVQEGESSPEVSRRRTAAAGGSSSSGSQPDRHVWGPQAAAHCSAALLPAGHCWPSSAGSGSKATEGGDRERGGGDRQVICYERHGQGKCICVCIMYVCA